MAETGIGIKFNRVPGNTRLVDGRKIGVKARDRSNPNTSTGKKRK